MRLGQEGRRAGAVLHVLWRGLTERLQDLDLGPSHDPSPPASSSTVNYSLSVMTGNQRGGETRRERERAHQQRDDSTTPKRTVTHLHEYNRSRVTVDVNIDMRKGASAFFHADIPPYCH